METTFEEALQLLKSGKSFDEATRTPRLEALPKELMRCAVVRAFDRNLYENVLKAGNTGDVSFDEVCESSDVARLPGPGGRFRVRESARQNLWNSWWNKGADVRTVPNELRELAELLVKHYKKPKPAEAEVDLLAALVLVDQQQAAEWFRKRFALADKSFRLARCQDLVDVLADECRAPLLNRELFELAQDRAAYLQARSMRSAEFLQTGTFLATPGTEDYEKLLEPSGPRLLEVHARGGCGKTMELRWLLSRVLVPRRIPCTATDFDFVDLAKAAKYPWLVLVDIATQLDQQLTRSPFAEFLRDYTPALPLLRRHASQSMREAAANAVQNMPEDVRDLVVGKFIRMYNSALGDRPAVLIFDTLEELHLRTEGGLDGLMTVVREVHDGCASARFVLSGRYPISSRVAEPPPMAERTPSLFEPEDAARYLDLRAITKPQLRAAIIEKAAGRPFTLALLADLVQQRPNLAASDIRKFEADLIYVVLRVIRRIPDARLRWLLRYGVVPRSLTLEFVQQVMQKYLRKGMSGNNEDDNPHTDDIPEQVGDSNSPFDTDVLPSADAPLPLQTLWNDLRRYAGTSSWVSENSGELRFHPDVLMPMRRLIRPRKIHRRLHEDAAAYFEARAAEDPANWALWTCEAVFHRFQMEGETAVSYWRAALDRVELGDADARARLAREVLGPDYLDDERRPRRWDKTRLVISPETVIEARYELAAASAQEARVLGVVDDDQRWSQVVEQLTLIDRSGLDVVPEHRLAYLRAALAFQQKQNDEAESLVRGALPHVHRTQDEVRFLVLLADISLRRGDSGAPAIYRRALRAAEKLSACKWEPALRRRVVLAHQRLGKLGEAMRELEATFAYEEIPAELRDELDLIAVDLGIASGRLSWSDLHAQALIERGTAPLRFVTAARVALAHRDPKAAHGLLVTAVVADDGRPVPPLFHDVWSLTGAMFADYSRALLTLETAREEHLARGDSVGAARCHVQSALLLMREVGDLSLAGTHLAKASNLLTRSEDPERLACTLAAVELRGRSGDPRTGLSLLASALIRLRHGWHPPELFVRAAVEGLALETPAHSGEFLDLLDEHLRLITPPSARLVALSGLKRVPDLHSDELRDRLRAIRPLLRLRDEGLSSLDRAALDLVTAELDRLTARRHAAETRLAGVYTEYHRTRSRYFVREWVQALDRLRSTAGLDNRVVNSFVRDFDGYPTLCVAFLVECAEARLKDRQGKRAKDLLERAEQWLTEAEGTQWVARHAKATAEAIRLHERDSERWRPYIAVAKSVFNVLGNAFKEWLNTDPAEGHSTTHLELSRCTSQLAVSRVDNTLEAETFVPPSTQLQQHFPPNHGVGALALDSLSFATSEVLVHDWRTIGTTLGKALLPDDAPEALTTHRDPLDFRCDIEDRRLDAAPWELSCLPEGRQVVALNPAVATLYRTNGRRAALLDEVRFAQMALNRLIQANLVVDGEIGRLTMRALQEYQAARDLTPDGRLNVDLLERMQRELASPTLPTVLVVAQVPRQQLHSSRSRVSSAPELQRVYQRFGFDVVVVDTPTLARVSDAVEWMAASGRSPGIVHIMAGLKQSPDGVALTFPLLTGFSELSATTVDRLIAYAASGDARPLVVLDVDRPSSTYDTAHYLLLRNAFAGELFALGRCAGVLGAGLADAERYEITSTMIESFANGNSIGETVRYLRSMVRDETDVERVLPFVGMALHTHVPWLRFTAGR